MPLSCVQLRHVRRAGGPSHELADVVGQRVQAIAAQVDADKLLEAWQHPRGDRLRWVGGYWLPEQVSVRAAQLLRDGMICESGARPSSTHAHTQQRGRISAHQKLRRLTLMLFEDKSMWVQSGELDTCARCCTPCLVLCRDLLPCRPSRPTDGKLTSKGTSSSPSPFRTSSVPVAMASTSVSGAMATHAPAAAPEHANSEDVCDGGGTARAQPLPAMLRMPGYATLPHACVGQSRVALHARVLVPAVTSVGSRRPATAAAAAARSGGRAVERSSHEARTAERAGNPHIKPGERLWPGLGIDLHTVNPLLAWATPHSATATRRGRMGTARQSKRGRKYLKGP
eukprot:353118-Chlamydomonas_euryale.AAC.2